MKNEMQDSMIKSRPDPLDPDTNSVASVEDASVGWGGARVKRARLSSPDPMAIVLVVGAIAVAVIAVTAIVVSGGVARGALQKPEPSIIDTSD